MSDPILEVEDLDIHYETKSGTVRAVSDASFTVERGEYFGLVGESGSGKSTVAKSLIGGLDPNGKIAGGTVRFDGEEIQDFDEHDYQEKIRWKDVSLIPQGSMSSLDPIERLSEQAVELAGTHTDWTEERTVERFRELFDIVGLPQSRIHDYPFQFSGGMQQRAIIAMALLLDPKLIIADEPTTALDVIMQDQILKYFDKIKEEENVSVLMITHDISVVLETCDQIGVLHAGQLCEVGTTEQVYENPRHPYSIMLQEAFPDIRYPKRELGIIEGYPPQLKEEVDYCTFADRCPWAVEECEKGYPSLDPINGDPNHRASCIRTGEMADLAADYLADEEEMESIIADGD
jgi:oligopeptide/dipeptide ABC transporter ATP-binding protein